MIQTKPGWCLRDLFHHWIISRWWHCSQCFWIIKKKPKQTNIMKLALSRTAYSFSSSCFWPVNLTLGSIVINLVFIYAELFTLVQCRTFVCVFLVEVWVLVLTAAPLCEIWLFSNVRHRDVIGHPWLRTGVCLSMHTHLLSHACLLSNTHTCSLSLHTHWTPGCIIDKLLITLVAISADLSREHPGSL